jgi:hypothetical protein
MTDEKIPRLIDVAHKYPRMYNESQLYKNPNITMDDIETIDKKYWNVDNIIDNPNLTQDFVLKYKYLKWNWYIIAEKLHLLNTSILYDTYMKEEFIECKEVDMKYIQKLSSKGFQLDWNVISDSIYKFNITIEDIELIISLPWNWEIIASRNDITIEFIRKHSQIFDRGGLWKDLTLNLSIPHKDIMENSELPWLWYNFSNRSDYNGIHGINVKYISEHQDYVWNWFTLSCVSNVTAIDAYPNLKWRWESVSFNKTLNIVFVLKHLNKLRLDMDNIFKILPINDILKYREKLDPDNIGYDVYRNPTINLKTFIEYYGDFPVQIAWMGYLCRNSNFSLEDLKYLATKVVTNPFREHTFGKSNILRDTLSTSVNLTPKYVLDHEEIDWYWNVNSISSNTFNYEKRKKWANHLQQIYLQKMNKRIGKYMKNENLLGANVLTDIVLEYK